MGFDDFHHDPHPALSTAVRPLDLELTPDGFVFPVNRAHISRARFWGWFLGATAGTFAFFVGAAAGLLLHWPPLLMALLPVIPPVSVGSMELGFRLVFRSEELVLRLRGRRLAMLRGGKLSHVNLGDSRFHLDRDRRELLWIQQALEALRVVPLGSYRDVPPALVYR